MAPVGTQYNASSLSLKKSSLRPFNITYHKAVKKIWKESYFYFTEQQKNYVVILCLIFHLPYYLERNKNSQKLRGQSLTANESFSDMQRKNCVLLI